MLRKKIAELIGNRESSTYETTCSAPDMVAESPACNRHNKRHLSDEEIKRIESGGLPLAAAGYIVREKLRMVEDWEWQTNDCPWPGNRITVHAMKRLRALSNCTKRPVNQLIQDAVLAYSESVTEEIKRLGLIHDAQKLPQ
ncbi:MAG: hypothetical protein AAF939_08270 [Planctomycetota bacterium]